MGNKGFGNEIDASVRLKLETLLQDMQLRDASLGDVGSAEDAIDRIYRRFISTLDTMLEGCQIISFDWRYIYLNDAVVKHSRASRSDLIGKRIDEVFPGILESPLGQAMKRCMVDRVPCEFDNAFQYPDGDMAWFKLSMQPSDEGIFILSIDITDQKNTESELRSSEKRLRIYIEQVADAVYILDRGRAIVDVNMQACAYSGYDKASLIGKCIDSVILFDKPRICPDCGGEICEGRFVDSIATQIKTDGTSFPVEIRAGAFMVNGDRNCLLLVRDISDRLRKERLAELLHCLHKRLSLEPNPQTLPLICLDGAVQVSGALEGRLLEYDLKRGRQVFAASKANTGSKSRQIQPGRSIAPRHSFFQNRQPTYLSLDQLGRYPFKLPGGTQSVAFLPILADGELRGGIVLFLPGSALDPAVKQELETLVLQFSPIFAKAKAQLELAHKQSELRTLLDAIPDLVFVKDTKGIYVECNPAFEAFLGRSRDRIIGFNDFDFFETAIAEEFRQHDLAMLRLGRPYQNEEIIAYPDGSQRIVETLKSPLRDQAGRVVAILGISRDITDRRGAEDRFRALVEGAPEPIWLQVEGRFGYANPAALRVLGAKSQADLIGREVLDIFDPEDRPLVKERVRLINEEGVAGSRRLFRCKRLDGRHVFLEISAIPVTDHGNHGSYVYAIDVSDKVQAQDELLRARNDLEHRVAERTKELAYLNKELESFSYSISHDLRSPLRSLDGMSRILEVDYGSILDEEGKQLIGRIRAASSKLDHLVQDILELSRVTRAQVRRESVNLSAVVAACIENFQHLATDRTVQCKVQPNIVVQADALLLGIAIDNLVGNAFKYSRYQELATIEFGSFRKGSETVFFIRDNGVGFDMAYAHQLFKPFHRLHHESSFEGTGIGLSSVNRIIEKHGGRIWPDAEPESGATFYFTLESPQDEF